jgi:hypothetical protein
MQQTRIPIRMVDDTLVAADQGLIIAVDSKLERRFGR